MWISKVSLLRVKVDWGVGKLVNLTPCKCLNKWDRNQLLPLPEGPVMAIKRCLASKSKTCSFLRNRNIFQVNQAHNFQRATPRTKIKKISANQVFFVMIFMFRIRQCYSFFMNFYFLTFLLVKFLGGICDQ